MYESPLTPTIHPVLQILLANDAPVDPVDKSKTTPLHLAAREGHRSVVKVLLQAGALLSARDGSGKAALELAILNGHRSADRRAFTRWYC